MKMNFPLPLSPSHRCSPCSAFYCQQMKNCQQMLSTTLSLPQLPKPRAVINYPDVRGWLSTPARLPQPLHPQSPPRAFGHHWPSASRVTWAGLGSVLLTCLSLFPGSPLISPRTKAIANWATAAESAHLGHLRDH